MNKFLRHFQTVCRHRAVVFHECRKCGLLWRGLVHDLSKFGPTEFIPSARYFQGDKSPIGAEKAKKGYSLAWQHHMGHNPHHWEYWIDYGPNGEIVTVRIPYKYVVEMVCDWIGAGKVYGGDNWTQSAPLDYYNRVRKGRHFYPETEALLVKFLECVRDKGLEEFHKMARCQPPYSYLAVDYEGLYVP